MSDNNPKKLIPKWSGTPVQLFQTLDVPNIEYAIVAYKYKNGDTLQVTWSKAANAELCHAVVAIEKTVLGNMFNK